MQNSSPRSAAVHVHVVVLLFFLLAATTIPPVLGDLLLHNHTTRAQLSHDDPRVTVAYPMQHFTLASSGIAVVGTDISNCTNRDADGVNVKPNPTRGFVQFPYASPRQARFHFMASINAVDALANSFFVQFDEGPGRIFDTGISGVGAVPEMEVSATDGSTTQRCFAQPAGNHTLRFFVREPGTSIANLTIHEVGPLAITQIETSGCPEDGCPHETELLVVILLRNFCGPEDIINAATLILIDGKAVCRNLTVREQLVGCRVDPIPVGSGVSVADGQRRMQVSINTSATIADVNTTNHHYFLMEAAAPASFWTTATTSTVLVLLGILFISLFVIIVWMLTKTARNIQFAPVDASAPFCVVVIGTTCASTEKKKKLASAVVGKAAEASRCFGLRHQMGSGSAFVAASLHDGFQLIVEVQNSLHRRGGGGASIDGSPNASNELSPNWPPAYTMQAAIAFGHGEIKPAASRQGEPEYAGTVVDTALELFDIACAIADHDVVLTVGEVRAELLDSMSGSNSSEQDKLLANIMGYPSKLMPHMHKRNNTNNKNNKAASAEEHDSVQGEEDSTSPGVSSYNNTNGGGGGDQEGIEEGGSDNEDEDDVSPFRDIADRKFRGGIIRRVATVALPGLPHPPQEAIASSCEHLLGIDGGGTDTTSSILGDLEGLSISQMDNAAAGGVVASNLSVKRRGSIVLLDCRRATDADALFRMHTIATSAVIHFGGEVESQTVVGFIGSFGVHRINVLHEQNACQCALAIQYSLGASVCITTGILRSCVEGATQRRLAMGAPIENAILLSKLIKAESNIGSSLSAASSSSSTCCRVLAQEDVVHATALPSLPFDAIDVTTAAEGAGASSHAIPLDLGSAGAALPLSSASSMNGTSGGVMVVHELFTERGFPFARQPRSASTFKECFSKMRIGHYGEAVECIRQIENSHACTMRLAGIARYALEHDCVDGVGRGYARTVTSVLPAVGGVTISADSGGGASAVPPVGMSVSASNSMTLDSNALPPLPERRGTGGSATLPPRTGSLGDNREGGGQGGAAAPMPWIKSPLAERHRQQKEEVSIALAKAGPKLEEVESGLFSMFVDDSDTAAAAAAGQNNGAGGGGGDTTLSRSIAGVLPTELVDVKGTRWHRSKQFLSGGYSLVYRAVSSRGRIVSIKCFDMESTRVRITAEEIADEVATLSGLSHENIIEYLTYGLVDRYCFIVMEHGAGGALSSMLSDFGPLPLEAAIHCMRGALRGLEYLHANGVVHCDMKPHNILLGSDGVCKIADFGSSINIATKKVVATISSAADESDAYDSQSTNMDDDGGGGGGGGCANHEVARGTALYMSPEACRGIEGEKPSDIWGLGITFIELLTGHVPWGRVKDVHRFIANLGSHERCMAPRIPAEFGEEISQLIASCLERDPEKRPTATSLLASPLFL